jgi:hypothetical protein
MAVWGSTVFHGALPLWKAGLVQVYVRNMHLAPLVPNWPNEAPISATG